MARLTLGLRRNGDERNRPIPTPGPSSKAAGTMGDPGHSAAWIGSTLGRTPPEKVGRARDGLLHRGGVGRDHSGCKSCPRPHTPGVLSEGHRLDPAVIIHLGDGFYGPERRPLSRLEVEMDNGRSEHTPVASFSSQDVEFMDGKHKRSGFMWRQGGASVVNGSMTAWRACCCNYCLVKYLSKHFTLCSLSW